MWPYPTLQLKNKRIRYQTVFLQLYTVLFVFYLKPFIYNHVDAEMAAELSVIYAVNYQCHCSLYEPYLEDQ